MDGASQSVVLIERHHALDAPRDSFSWVQTPRQGDSHPQPLVTRDVDPPGVGCRASATGGSPDQVGREGFGKTALPSYWIVIVPLSAVFEGLL